jgi:hypothetical protein
LSIGRFLKTGDVKYNSSRSSKFSENATALSLDFNFILTTSTLAQDTFRLGALEIPAQLFQEAITVDLIGLS